MNQAKVHVLVSGSTGQLGQELQKLSSGHIGYSFDFKSRNTFDLSSTSSIKQALRKKEYDFIINCGAYTAVDKAEKEVKKAFKVNATSLSTIAKYANKKTKIIHISSDYVYHLDLDRPLLETDKTKAVGIYAKSKLEGEQHLLSLRPDSLVIRTSWVYSSFGNNFVKTMLRLGKLKDALTIVSDQYGSPTYAHDIGQTIIHLMNNINSKSVTPELSQGIYNYSNMGMTNWADFAREIFKLSDIDCKVLETDTLSYGAPAPRPLWSLMSKEKIQRNFQLKIPHWKKSLKSCLHELI